MDMRVLVFKIKRKLVYLFSYYMLMKPKIWLFRLLSDCRVIVGRPVAYQPVKITGQGKVIFGKNVRLGVLYSPRYHSGYVYIEARKPDSLIEIDDDCWINNSASIISNGKRIKIGKKCLIGYNLEISDSDFHDINPENRAGGNVASADVIIGDNVFMGNNVTIMKGVTIGRNCVIGNRAVVVKSVPENSVAAGNPAKVIRNI